MLLKLNEYLPIDRLDPRDRDRIASRIVLIDTSTIKMIIPDPQQPARSIVRFPDDSSINVLECLADILDQSLTPALIRQGATSF